MKYLVKKFIMLALSVIGLATPIEAVFYFGTGFGPRYRSRNYYRRSYGYPYRNYYRRGYGYQPFGYRYSRWY